MSESIQVVTKIVPAYAALHLKGHINTFAEEPIQGEIEKLLEMKCPLILMDFSEVEHINSAGITILIGEAGRVRDRGAQLAAYGLSEHYRKIFLMVGLEEFILLGEDGESLVRQWQRAGEIMKPRDSE